MSEPGASRSLLQSALLRLYRMLRGSALMRTPAGQRAFELAYAGYKTLIEAGPIARLQDYVKPGSLAIDVGANIGTFTQRFAHWTGERGRVIAIEPETKNFSALRRRLSAQGLEPRVTALQAVAAESAGTLMLQINPDHPGDHKIGAQGVPTRAVTLDEMAGGDARAVSLIKIDVQGAEMRVLRGAQRLLAAHKPALFVEVDDNALRQQQSSAGELVAFLAGLGYRPYRLQRSGPPVALAGEPGTDGYEDVLFLAD